VTKVLVIGSDGQLARAIIHSAPQQYQISTLNREKLDITKADSVREAIQQLTPDLVINGAAYNAVDKAQGEGAADALSINALGVANLALASLEVGARLVHFSTDFVFDGRKTSPYLETDATGPLSIYGASKLCGENICISTSPRNIAIRVCRLFGPVYQDGAGTGRKPGGNFPALMVRLGKERESLRVVNDQIGSPTYTPDLAAATWQLIGIIQSGGSGGEGGLFQLSNDGEVSFADYAEEILRRAQVNCKIEHVSSAEYGAPARRPLYSTFSNKKAHSLGVTPLRHWSEALDEFLRASES
jgi:dTDP-4-dehydrorhamnose reductase